jgi:glyoxylase-like metal-dependent hydrolase (beta-lactamase superfamily II)
VIEVRMYTVGPLQENCFIARRTDATEAFVIDPGDQAADLAKVIEELGLDVKAILLTHTHFDHVGAVAELHRATGAPVWCPELETHMLANINDFVFPGMGPYEAYDADETIAGGETLQIAGFDIDVIFTPGHSPGHVTFSIPDEQIIFSGDVLFQGSIGRTDLPGGDYGVLMQSISTLLEQLPDETRVCPGHMGPTTLGAERQTNPFLTELV